MAGVGGFLSRPFLEMMNMKRITGMLAGFILPLYLSAGEVNPVVFDSTAGSAGKTSVPTNGWIAAGQVMTSAIPVRGFVKQLEIITSDNVQTCAVVVITATNYGSQAYQTVFSNMAVSASGVYRPRVTAHDTAGGALMASTNAFEDVFLAEEYLKCYVWKSTFSSNCTIKVKVKLWQ